MTLRERVEGLVKLWRKRGADDTASGKLENPWVLECADELAAALAAEGPHCEVCNAPLEVADGEHVCGLTASEAYSLGWRRGNNATAPSLHKEALPLQRTLPDEQFKGAVVEAIGAQEEGITLKLDFATAGAIGLFEFLRSKGFEVARPAGRAEQEQK